MTFFLVVLTIILVLLGLAMLITGITIAVDGDSEGLMGLPIGLVLFFLAWLAWPGLGEEEKSSADPIVEQTANVSTSSSETETERHSSEMMRWKGIEVRVFFDKEGNPVDGFIKAKDKYAEFIFEDYIKKPKEPEVQSKSGAYGFTLE